LWYHAVTNESSLHLAVKISASLRRYSAGAEPVRQHP